ncbi:uncharacterized protein YcbK (DUF882 family) [Stella humosa]|uniref:Murein endopeptidase K n=1 Tax=Stella humosa TaxID=94 RepID=A0A3N1M823_9PROT|nr:DUF882 domain-containing protein [Stella humosa]ROP99830.1 uncharacterized protein YcbK (DUF882 family) [Stella humosa]BBK30942.1 hypothetical protein STHU_15760 [Stella humosa]
MKNQPSVLGGMGMPSRRRLLCGLGAALAVCVTRPALAVVREAQPDRRLHLHNVNTLETVDIAYFRDGRYQPDALQTLSRFLRDYRSGRVARMDPGLYDYLHDLQEAVRLDEAQPTRIISGYRSPETNRSKRSRDRSVARDSYHTRGQAFDVVLPDRDVMAVRAVAVKLERGGVGAYPRAGFLHLDVGPARAW